MIRLNGLDGLRGLLAITVMMSHLVGSFIGWTDDRAFIGAYLSVVYFFMMSGFVLSYSHNNDTNFFKYALIRLARLLPLHIITTLIIVLLFKYNSTIGAYVPNEEVFSIKTILKNILFLNGVYWNEFYVINAPSWSISIEFWVSLLIPLVFNRLRLAVKCIIVAFWLPFIYFKFPMGFTQSIQIAALSMLLGSICFEFTKKPRILDFLKEYNANLFIFFSFLLCLIGVYSANHSRVDIVYMLFFIPLLFIDFTNEEFWLRKLLSSNFFLFLGFVSFPLYLLHDLVIVSGVAKHDNVVLSMFIAGFISISLAFLYARCIDIYLYKKMKLIINRMF